MDNDELQRQAKDYAKGLGFMLDGHTIRPLEMRLRVPSIFNEVREAFPKLLQIERPEAQEAFLAIFLYHNSATCVEADVDCLEEYLKEGYTIEQAIKEMRKVAADLRADAAEMRRVVERIAEALREATEDKPHDSN